MKMPTFISFQTNLHHGHSEIPNVWGRLIKASKKITTTTEPRMGIKLLAWSIKNIEKIFPDFNAPEYWSGNFQPGIEFWSKTPLWKYLTNQTYIDHNSMKIWANSIPTIENESINIYDSLEFLG